MTCFDRLPSEQPSAPPADHEAIRMDSDDDDDDELEESEVFQDEEESEEPFRGEEVHIHAKWMLDDCATLDQAAAQCMYLANTHKEMHEQGWELGCDVQSDHGMAYREVGAAWQVATPPLVQDEPLVPAAAPLIEPQPPDEDGNEYDPVLRAKWTLDGCATLLECAYAWKDLATHCRQLKAQGWELREPIADDFGFLARAVPSQASYSRLQKA
jgi:hypothetical protein